MVVGSGVSGALLAACGGAPPSGGRSTPGAPGIGAPPVTLSLWDRLEPLYPEFIEAWLPGFRAKYPNATVEFVPAGEGAIDKFTAALAGGTPPDVALVNSSRHRYHAEQKHAQPLDAFIKAAGFDSRDFLQGIYRGMNWGGQQTSIPQYVNTNMLYYNREHFKRAGLAAPKDDWTPDQLVAAATKLTRGPLPVRDTWGLSVDPASVTVRAGSLLWARGARFTDPKNPDVFAWTAPPNVAAFQWLHDLTWKQRVNAATDDDRRGDAHDVAFFSSGSVSMYLEGAARLATWKEKAQTDWDVAALPRGSAGRGERGALDGYLMPVGVKNPDAAWGLIQSLTDGESNRLRAELVGLPPVRKSQLERWAQAFPGHNIKIGLPTDQVQPDPAAVWPRGRELGAPLGQVWSALFIKNELSVQDALKKANDVVAGLLGPSAVR